jgi:hypothetical protein
MSNYAAGCFELYERYSLFRIKRHVWDVLSALLRSRSNTKVVSIK